MAADTISAHVYFIKRFARKHRSKNCCMVSGGSTAQWDKWLSQTKNLSEDEDVHFHSFSINRAYEAVMNSDGANFDFCLMHTVRGWRNAIAALALSLRLLKSEGWLCIYDTATIATVDFENMPVEAPQNSTGKLNNSFIDLFVLSNGEFGNFRWYGPMIFAKKTTCTSLEAAVVIGRVLERSRLDPEYRFRLLRGMALPSNSSFLQTNPTPFGLSFVELSKAPFLGYELQGSGSYGLSAPAWQSESRQRPELQAFLSDICERRF